MLPTGPVSGSGGSRLELGGLGAACCAALGILAVCLHVFCFARWFRYPQFSLGCFWDGCFWRFLLCQVGSAGVGRSRQAGDYWCDHTSAPRSSTCPRGAVGMEHFSCCCPGKQFCFIFPRQNSPLSFCSGHFTLKLLLFQRSCNFYELLWVI